MHYCWFFNDQTVCIEFPDILTGVGIADFGGFIWIEPDFAFAYAEDFGSK